MACLAVVVPNRGLGAQPNEVGAIMVLMYHGIGPRESEWVRTPENFRNDLQMLYNKGYRPISLMDYLSNDINTQEGKTPIVITFDDGAKGQFNILEEQGERTVDPNSAVGILLSFHKEHSDFPLEAIFFLNGAVPFFQPDFVEYKLNFLIENGMDIGNHTERHNNLGTVQNPARIQRFIGKQAFFLEDSLTDYHPGYKVNTLALCYGQRPKPMNLQYYLRKGIYRGRRYENIAVLNVGFSPAFSPVHKRFNPYSLARIRASEIKTQRFGIMSWVEYFERNPLERFVSDGDPNTVTVPRSLLKFVDLSKLKERRLNVR
jgi:hypothetical protein